MKYQLAFQFNANMLEQYEGFIALTDSVTTAIAGEPETIVDGHDSGLGEFNIFIHTNEPQSVFEKTADFIGEQLPEIAFRAGYRAFGGGKYIPLWPTSAKSFSVL